MKTIKMLANQLNISENKLRFYEKKGLIKPMRDPLNGYRYYEQEDLIKIKLILLYRRLDFSIDQIQLLMQEDDKKSLMHQLLLQWQTLTHKINRYEKLQASLESVMDAYLSSNQSIDDLFSALPLEDLLYEDYDKTWDDPWQFDTWAKDYDADVKMAEDKLGLFKCYDQLLDKVYSYATKTEDALKILEVGVGTGNLACKFLKSKHRIMAIDPSKEMLYVANSKHPNLRLRLGHFLDVPFPDNSFDRIISTYAFHHLNDEEKVRALDEVFRVMDTSGQLIIGDLMFENKEKGQTILERLTADDRAIIEDEYYTDIERLEKEVNQRGYGLSFEKIDTLVYIIIIKKEKSL